MRYFGPVVMMCLAAACSQTAEEADKAPSPTGEAASDPDMCVEDTDCVLVASTCCECPSFAVPKTAGYDVGCEDVDCGSLEICPAVTAVCDLGACVTVCAPIVTTRECALGFAEDEFGCQIDVCLEGGVQVPECEQDSDCIRVPADCCGCERGGQDTAVSLDRVEEHNTGLGCSPESVCPDIDVCEPEVVAMCNGGMCSLVSAPPTAPAEMPCGSPELEPCPPGYECVLNDAGSQGQETPGLGVCRPE